MPPKIPLPTGKITIVFTDIEGSSRMTNDLGTAAYLEQLRNPHQKVLLTAFERHNGVAVLTQGDSFMAVFQAAQDALACVAAIQNQLAREPITVPRKAQPEKGTGHCAFRIGVHTTEEDMAPDRMAWIPNAEWVAGHVEYSGTDTNFAARVAALGSGGQIIVSHFAYTAAEKRGQYQWRSWPNRRLKSFEDAPETVWELLYDGQSRGEPGVRWVPDWYRGELNRYVARPELQETVIAHFQAGQDVIRKRLVTLYAEGGMGKSRLAVACALEMVGLFQNGVYFVNLAQDEGDPVLRTRETVAQNIGLALGLSGQELQPENLLASLRASERLLVLDNYESVDSQDVRRFLRDLIVQTNSLCLLVTGRTPVNLPDVEQIVPMSRGMTPDQARRLFLAYAGLTERGSHWTLDSEDEKELERILILTERIPLAVELAAAWAGVRTLKEIADGLQKTPLGRMTRTPGDTDRADPSPHHYSLTRSLDWSYGLLTEDAQTAFASLSLFAASFVKEAVAAVFAHDEEEAEDTLDYLHRVSLVRRTEGGKTSRYSLHRFTREYAREKLAALPQADAVRRRFVDFYCLLPARNGDLNKASHRAALTAEWQNALAAAQIAEAEQQWTSVLALSRLDNFLSLRGLWSEQERLSLSSLAAAQALGDRSREAQALTDLGSVYRKQGQWDQAEQVGEKSLSLKREMGDRQGEAAALNVLGEVYHCRSQWDKAVQAFGESLETYRELRDREKEAWALNALGIVYDTRGQSEQAEQMYEQSLTIRRELGDRRGEGVTLCNLGTLYLYRDQWDKAETAYRLSLDICREIGDRESEAAALNNLGGSLQQPGEWEQAEHAYQDSLVIKQEIGDRQSEAETLINVASLMQVQGKGDESVQKFGECLTIFRELGDRKGEGEALRNLAGVMQAQGKHSEAIARTREAVTVLEQTEDAAGLTKAQALLAELSG